MVSQRELQNIGRLGQDEHDMALSGTRSRRSCASAITYSQGHQETDIDSDLIGQPESPRRKSSSKARLKITTKSVEKREKQAVTVKKPVSSSKARKPKLTPRKSFLQVAQSDSAGSPKRRKLNEPASPLVKDTVVKADDVDNTSPPVTPERSNNDQSKLLTPPDTGSNRPIKHASLSFVKNSSPVIAATKPKTKTASYDDERTRFNLIEHYQSQQSTGLSQEKLEQLSAQLHQRAKRTEKPEPTGQPLVWAESRRELCEALPYYRSYKGGAYCSQGVAHAFMFDHTGHPRDYLDSSVVIARAGGGMAKEDKNGPMVLSRDQETTAQIRALNKNITEFRPVGIIAGDEHSDIQSKMPYKYQFLDWFKPTDIWCEKWNKHVVVRYRFEKLRPQEPSWWTPSGETDELPLVCDNIEALASLQSPCQSCSVISSQVYLNGWMCLYPTCNKFWTFANGREPVDEELKYDPRFLKRYTPWPHGSTPWETKPNPFNLSIGNATGETHMEDFGELTKAIVCPKCGRCTAAKFWTYWSCGNDECRLSVPLPCMAMKKPALRELTYSISDGYSFSKDVYDPSITLEISFVGNYRVHKYTLPGVPGFVVHMMANKTVVEEQGGPDDMFMDLQDNEIGLERRAKDDSRISGENLCDHYTLNFGMPYKFVASPDSKPFSLAPKSVAMARSQLNWALRALGIAGEPDFNELMVLGYKSANKIGYHDDGEEGLGPTVATLSVGCPAEMKLKMQEKYFRGFTGKESKKHFTDKLPPIPGGNKYEQRLVAYNDLIQLKDSDKEAYNARKLALPHELGLVGQGNKTGAPEVLKMRLAHGDVVVMHGALIQAYYLHCVEPKGSLRFAFTCRNILANHLKEEEMPEYEVEPDEIKYDGFKLPLPL